MLTTKMVEAMNKDELISAAGQYGIELDGKTAKKDTLAIVLAGVLLQADEIEAREAALAAEQEDLDTEKQAFEDEKKAGRTATKAEDPEDPDAHKAGVDAANARAFKLAKKARAERCQVPLSEDDRVVKQDLERRCRTQGPDEQPSPAEMMQLGELRERARLGD